MSTSSFRGKVQASSTSQSVFRVIWRNDTFTTPNDANYMYTISGLSRTSSGRGGRRLQSGSVLSQEIDLEVSREAACDLVAWAKREFPSVAVSESRVDHEGIAGPTGSVLCPLTGSLRNVRKGVETTVRACVLEVSNVEHMWTWETARGKGSAAQHDNDSAAACSNVNSLSVDLIHGTKVLYPLLQLQYCTKLFKLLPRTESSNDSRLLFRKTPNIFRWGGYLDPFRLKSPAAKTLL